MNAPFRTPTAVRHIVKGEVVEGGDLEYGPAHARFATPKLELDRLVWSRQEPPPAADTPVDEIIDVLVATGERLGSDPDGFVAEAMERSFATSPYPRDLVERSFKGLAACSPRQHGFMREQDWAARTWSTAGARSRAPPSGPRDPGLPAAAGSTSSPATRPAWRPRPSSAAR